MEVSYFDLMLEWFCECYEKGGSNKERMDLWLSKYEFMELVKLVENISGMSVRNEWMKGYDLNYICFEKCGMIIEIDGM